MNFDPSGPAPLLAETPSLCQRPAHCKPLAEPLILPARRRSRSRPSCSAWNSAPSRLPQLACAAATADTAAAMLNPQQTSGVFPAHRPPVPIATRLTGQWAGSRGGGVGRLSGPAPASDWCRASNRKPSCRKCQAGIGNFGKGAGRLAPSPLKSLKGK